jgi:hypothetical protein
MAGGYHEQVLESPQSRARIAADWLLDIFFDQVVTQIRDHR